MEIETQPRGTVQDVDYYEDAYNTGQFLDYVDFGENRQASSFIRTLEYNYVLNTVDSDPKQYEYTLLDASVISGSSDTETYSNKGFVLQNPVITIQRSTVPFHDRCFFTSDLQSMEKLSDEDIILRSFAYIILHNKDNRLALYHNMKQFLQDSNGRILSVVPLPTVKQGGVSVKLPNLRIRSDQTISIVSEISVHSEHLMI